MKNSTMETLTKKKKHLKLSFKIFDQGLLNAVNEQIWKEKDVQMSGFQVTHPEVGEAIFTLKTKSKDAKTVWNASITNLSKDIKALLKQI